MTQSIYLLWDGEAFRPIERMKYYCAENFEVGRVHRFAVDGERSMASHNHYFAALTTAFSNLPEDTKSHFLNFDHFRSWCLMKCGFANQDLYPMDSVRDAKLLATEIGRRHPYAVISIVGATVQVLTPESQSKIAMGHKTFQKSKDAVLDLAASMIGVPVAELKENSRNIANLQNVSTI